MASSSCNESLAEKEYIAFEEKVKRTVYLDNLSPQVTKAVLVTALGQFGSVVSTQFIPKFIESNDIPNCALVELETEVQAKAVISVIDNYPFMIRGMPKPVTAKPAEAEMFGDRPVPPSRKIAFEWLNHDDPKFEVAKRVRLIARRHTKEAAALLQFQLEEEEKLEKHQAEMLKSNYKKLKVLEKITADGSLDKLAKAYGKKL